MSVFGFSTASSAGSDIIPACKYDARSGRVFRNDRIDTGNGFVSEQVDITRNFKAVFDLENVETGWIMFAAGTAPLFTLVPLGSPIPPAPSPDFKNGIRFLVKLSKDCGGGVREMAGTSKAFMAGVEKLYLEYLAGREANAGKLPVVEMPDTLAVKSGQSTNYQPLFQITGWAPRGDFKFVPRGGAAAVAAPANTGPASTGSTRVDPPAPRATARTPEVVLAGEDEFG